MDNIHNPKCYADHMGAWMIKPEWFKAKVQAIKSGMVKAQEPETDHELFIKTASGVAIIPIVGQINKGFSKFGGTSSVFTRMAVREAMKDKSVKAVMLHIDSPGGMVAGTAELAEEIANADKPIRAHIDDLGASAAYWVAAQAGLVTANKMAEVGSIGTFVVLEDTSGKAEMEGIKVHVISTGPFKGAFADGAPITEEQLADLQTRVNDVNAHFLEAVAQGRDMDMEKVESVADGRSMIAAKALEAGLIDGIMNFEDAVMELSNLVSKSAPRNKRARNILDLNT